MKKSRKEEEGNNIRMKRNGLERWRRGRKVRKGREGKEGERKDKQYGKV